MIGAGRGEKRTARIEAQGLDVAAMAALDAGRLQRFYIEHADQVVRAADDQRFAVLAENTAPVQ